MIALILPTVAFLAGCAIGAITFQIITGRRLF
jgi:hypothetical protein